MKYVLEISINSSLDKVIKAFFNKMIMCKDIREGNTCTFTYDIDSNHKMIMKESIESINIPNEIITIYETDKVWNRWINQFEERDGKVIFRMDVEFRFEDEAKIDQKSFENKTLQDMEDFKKFVEDIYLQWQIWF